MRKEVAALAKAKGFIGLTEVQLAAIPKIEAGQDTLVIGPTGHGKTEAALLPLLSKLLDLRDSGHTPGIQLLYITPLKALNRNMSERLNFWCDALGITHGVRHGDTSSSERQRLKRNPPVLLVTTPESLGTLLVAPELGAALANVRVVVVDEVHELVDSKRGIQLSLALERLRERCGGFQIVGLSATVGDAKQVAGFLSPKASVVQVRLPRGVELSVDCPAPSKASKDLAKILRIPAGYAARVNALQDAIDSSKSTLVFVNTRFAAESLGSLFYQIRELGETIGVHHSSLSKEARLEAEERFKGKEGEDDSKRLKALICTSSLELGIDIGAIELVVQYGSPRQVSRLLQRVGRSGHTRDRTPRGLVLALDPLDAAEAGVVCSRARKTELEPTHISQNNLDVLAHQLAGLTLDFEKVPLSKALSIFQRAYPYRTLELDDLWQVAMQLDSQGTLSLDQTGKVVQRTKRTLFYYYENLSTIPDEKRYFVKDAGTRGNVALLDEAFVAENLTAGVVFIARGKPWRVLSVSDDEVVVEAARSGEGAVPDWEGEEIPVDQHVAQQVAGLLSKLTHDKLSRQDALEGYSLTPGAYDDLAGFAKDQSLFFHPSPSELVLESRDNILLIHSFQGLRCNQALARALSFILTGQSGSSVRVHSSPYSIMFEFPGEAPVQRVEQAIRSLKPSEFDKFLRAGLTGTPLFRWRWTHVAKRFGFLRKDADLSGIGLKKLVENTKDSVLWREAFAELFWDDFDASAATKLLESMESGSVDLLLAPPRQKWSPLALSHLQNGGLGELLSPQEPTEQLLEAFKEHVLDQRSGLLCLYCGATWSREVREHPDQPVCIQCGSNQITTDEYTDAVKARKLKRAAKPEEKKRYDDALRVASQIAAYGKRALIALATYGVGPENASRVLSRLRPSEREFFQDLYDAQVSFVKTRRFWKV